ncbi:putative myb-related protein-like [Capsicum annuum]|uniref:protein PTST homolog 3, chloroplastic isoform X1 n=2 Tax=Capsicum annuum TaxID=4072 RepID=UPI001FB10D5B|nr:protein PTST homolog 3, chloroplastic isoform X1 [Capsicum annuum]KAF3632898.1 putative myb-related protein-like [Capsicum annuum]
MASVFHFPTSHKLFSLSLPPSLSTHHNHHFFIICSSKSAISASIKKTRASRKVKSNDDLCNDIREFLSSVGLPDDHVPTMKELSQHGRQDLANIVRRRGYKLVKELLLTSKQPTYECRGEDVVVEKSEDELLDGKKTDTTHDVSLPSEASAVDDDTNYADNGIILNSDEQNSGDQEPLDYSSLEEKVANFIENGELESVEDDDLDIFQRSEQVERSVEGKNVVATDSTTAELFSGNSIAQSTQHVEHPSRPSSPTRKDKLSTENLTVNEGRIRLDTEPHNMEIEAEINHLKLILHQKELELTQLKQQIEKEMRLLSMMEIEAETKIREAHRILSEKDAELNAAEDSLSGLKEVEIEYQADAESVEVAGSFNGWHQKIKMDLEESSDPIGEDKQASSDSIDPIGEDIQASSDSIDPIGIRKPRLWKTVLWLYPGIYEIKFVVDGHHWTTDPQRETLTRGSIHNNVLRVDR